MLTKRCKIFKIFSLHTLQKNNRKQNILSEKYIFDDQKYYQ
jgi:hypothetical protein